MENELFEKVVTVPNHQHRFIGQLPEEWRIEKLADLAEITQGVSKGRDFEGKKVVRAPYLRVANVLDGGFDLSEIKDIELLESEQDRYLIRKNDILITEGGDPDKLGRGGIWKGDIKGLVYQNHLFRIRCTEAVLLPDFLSQYIQGRAAKNYFLACAKQTTGIASINMGQIKTTPVPIPPIDEQQRILNVLTAHDGVLKIARQLLIAKKQRKRALMQQLLTGQKRLPGFSGDLREVKLGEVFRRVSRRNGEGNTNVLTISAQRGLISQTEFFNKSVASEEVLNYFLLKRGEFAYNKSSSVGYDYGAIKRLDLYDKGILSPLYICLSLADGNSDFYTHLFEAGRINHGIYQIAQEGARNHGLLNIGVNDFFQIKFNTPALDEQIAIASVLNAADDEIRLAKAEVEALSRQKRGLRQQLLTGKTRVKI